jgi:hypothetical protein
LINQIDILIIKIRYLSISKPNPQTIKGGRERAIFFGEIAKGG